MLTSSRRSLSYPNPATRADRADVPTDIATVIAALELDVVFGSGTLASRPAAGAGAPAATGGGRLWWASDTQALYYDTGAAWVGPLNPAALGANSVTTAMLQDDSVTAAKIAAGAVGASEIADGTVSATELAAALFPSQGAGAGTEALRALGTGAANALAGNNATVAWALAALTGKINANGTIAGGTGFTCVFTGPDSYAITFTTPFSVPPVVTCQQYNGTINLNAAPTVNGFTVITQGATSAAWNFMVFPVK